jgi:signal peptidase II
MTATRSMQVRIRYIAILCIVVLCDQLSKWVVEQRLPLYQSHEVIRRFLAITHVQNPGAAFSLFAGYAHANLVLSLFVATSILVMLWLIWREPSVNLTGIGLAMIAGGAIGNLIDRIRVGSVLDFIAVDLGKYHWPDFNLADSSIVLGAMMVGLSVLRSPDEKSLSI